MNWQRDDLNRQAAEVARRVLEIDTAVDCLAAGEGRRLFEDMMALAREVIEQDHRLAQAA